MNKVIPSTADGWLALSEYEGMALFSEPADAARQSLRRLLREWHPDRNADPRAGEVFGFIRRCYERALGGRFHAPKAVRFADDHGRLFEFRFHAQEAFELGTYYRAKHSLAYHITPAYRPWFDQAVARLSAPPYADAAMRTQMSRVIPTLQSALWGPDGGLLVLRKDPRAIRLRDWMHARQTPIPAHHVAWVGSACCNAACYLDYARWAHQAWLPEHVWIIPETHEIQLLGGWFYAQPYGSAIEALPAAALASAPHAYLTQKQAGPALDLALIQALLRELLGDRSGMSLTPSADVPAAFIEAVRRSPVEPARTHYARWKADLVRAFGPPRFVPLSLSSTTIYPEARHG